MLSLVVLTGSKGQTSMKGLSLKIVLRSFLVLFVCCFGAALSYAQAVEQSEPKVFETKARASDAATMRAGKATIALWGVRVLDNLPVLLAEKGRVALDNAVGDEAVQCKLKSRANEYLLAQCVNNADQDLGLLMLQKGYVSVDRVLVYGSIYETPYLQAEENAQSKKIGIWAEQESSGSQKGFDMAGLMVLVGCLILVILFVFGALTFIIMRGFQKVIDAQNRNIDMLGRERKLKDKERSVVASMLDSEIKANKSKVEAYLVVYEEMLADMKNPQRQPKYKKVGDILQKQPALDRAVFDRNTDKLDMLGDGLVSEVIHFYARIKTKPDYINLEPELPLDDAIGLVQEGLGNAKRMNVIADRLIDAFSEMGVSESGA